jgi:hypothetical protein
VLPDEERVHHNQHCLLVHPAQKRGWSAAGTIRPEHISSQTPFLPTFIQYSIHTVMRKVRFEQRSPRWNLSVLYYAGTTVPNFL